MEKLLFLFNQTSGHPAALTFLLLEMVNLQF